MPKPKVEFTDTVKGCIDLLTANLPAALTARGLSAAGLTVSGDTAGTRPHVMVRQDGSLGQYPVQERNSTRVVVFATSQPLALRIAKLCKAVLLSTDGTALVRATAPLNGPAPAVDPDTDEPLADFTLYVQGWPQQFT